MFGASASMQQALDQKEVTADSFGSFTVSFDYGWRNHSTGDDFKFTFEIVGLTKEVVLGKCEFRLPTKQKTDNQFTLLGADEKVVIKYNNRRAVHKGHEIALRIRGESTRRKGFKNTAWIEDISLTAA